MVKRWKNEMSSNPTSCWMQEDKDGNYVLYADYHIALVSKDMEILEMQRKLDEIERVLLGGR